MFASASAHNAEGREPICSGKGEQKYSGGKLVTSVTQAAQRKKPVILEVWINLVIALCSKFKPSHLTGSLTRKIGTNKSFLPYWPHFLLKDKPQTSLAELQSSNCSLSLTLCPSHDLFCTDSSQHLLSSPPQCPGDRLYHKKRTCSKATLLNASPGLPEDDPAHEEKAGRFVTILPLLVRVSWRVLQICSEGCWRLVILF